MRQDLILMCRVQDREVEQAVSFFIQLRSDQSGALREER